MDFANNSSTPHQSQGSQRPAPAASAPKKKTSKAWTRVLRWGTGILLITGSILVLALLASIVLTKTHEESKFVNKNEMQAVFLSGGQVYFGNITALNSKYVTLNNIYYLRVNQTVQPNQANNNAANDVSLVKLGCELHGPTDQMVINSDQVIFWENLKSDGQVAKAVQTFQKQNPNGLNCNAKQ